MTIEIVLARHGETKWNTQKRIQGQIDIPLSENGIKQSRELGEQIKDRGIGIIVSSPLLRALETSVELNKSLGVTILTRDGLMERSYGEFEGRLLEDVDAQFKDRDTTLKSCNPEEGESYSGLQKRVLTAFYEIIGEHKDEKILIVCHGGVLEVLVKHLSIGRDEEEREKDDVGYSFPNASVLYYSVDVH